MTLKAYFLGGRNLWADEPMSVTSPSDTNPAPTDAIVFLHPEQMVSLGMLDFVVSKRVSGKNIVAISPESYNVTEWDYTKTGNDVPWLDETLPGLITTKYPTVTRIHLVGIGNGGDAVNAVAAYGHNNYYSYTQVCSTQPKTQPSATNTLTAETPVQIYMGENDSLVPIAGNNDFMSLANVTSFYTSIGGVVTSTMIPNCGHSWAGGNVPLYWRPYMFGGYSSQPDITSEIVALVAEWRA